jgi:tripartite-type tricarboxylate transporter receptor subunit TctC
MKMIRCILSVAIGLGLAGGSPARAEPYPTTLVKIVTPFAPGGGADVLCRLVAEKLQAVLKQPFIVENRTGASGNIGAEAVAKAAPDGHVLLCAPDPVLTSYLLYSKLAFDPRSFAPVTVFAVFRMGLVARADAPFSTVSELVAYASSHPGRLTYGSQGIGQYGHLLLEALKLRENLDIVHVPYRGGAPAVNDLLGGQVNLLAGPLTSTMQLIEAGQLKLLAPTDDHRLAAFPDVPALPETVRGLSASSWLAIAAPSGTPTEITTKLASAVAQVVRTPEMKARFAELQSETLGSTPEEMRDLTRRAAEQWADVIAKGQIHLD